jgi:hypothetical protein
MYAEFRASTQGVFAEALQDVPDEDVPAVVHLSGAVLDSTLRARSLGRTTLEQAEERLRRAVELVFSDPPVRRT